MQISSFSCNWAVVVYRAFSHAALPHAKTNQFTVLLEHSFNFLPRFLRGRAVIASPSAGFSCECKSMHFNTRRFPSDSFSPWLCLLDRCTSGFLLSCVNFHPSVSWAMINRRSLRRCCREMCARCWGPCCIAEIPTVKPHLLHIVRRPISYHHEFGRDIFQHAPCFSAVTTCAHTPLYFSVPSYSAP